MHAVLILYSGTPHLYMCLLTMFLSQGFKLTTNPAVSCQLTPSVQAAVWFVWQLRKETEISLPPYPPWNHESASSWSMSQLAADKGQYDVHPFGLTHSISMDIAEPAKIQKLASFQIPVLRFVSESDSLNPVPNFCFTEWYPLHQPKGSTAAAMC